MSQAVSPKEGNFELTAGARPKRGIFARFGRFLLLGVGPLVLALVGGAYVATTARYVTTENAYIKADKIALSSEVSGHVAEVLVRENDIVELGQLLFRLGEARFRIALSQKQAALQSARQHVEGLRALHRQKRVELRSAREEIDFYNGEYERAKRLKKQGHMSNAKFEAVRLELTSARHRMDAVRQDIAGVLANLGGDPAMPIEEHPLVLAAQTAVEEAKLDLNRTAVIAPARAIVSNIDMQIGEYVELGEPVFSLVDVERFWVEANLKETDLTHLREGQPALITIDAYPDYQWRATVSGIAPATGAEFSLLPPQNASGNWVKVVQRVPVRLAIERAPDEPPLRAGMSVRVEVDTGVEMDLPGPVRAALAWVQEKQPQFGR